MRRHEGKTYRRGFLKDCVLPAMLAMVGTGCFADLYFGLDEDPNQIDPAVCEDKPGDSGVTQPGFELQLGPTVTADNPPPPISGGTLALTPDQTMAIAADSDRDQVYLIALQSASLSTTIPLQAGDEPGRIVVDDAQRAHVALRSGGAVATIDLLTGAVIARREVCAAPRGLAFDDQSGALYVACHGGELIAMDPATGGVLSQQTLAIGLRDVVPGADHIYVTHFRTAEVTVLDREGGSAETMKPPGLDTIIFDPMTGQEREAHFEPAVAWRAVPDADGGMVMLHQRARDGKVSVGQGGYGGDRCGGGIVHAAVTPMKSGETTPVTAPLGFSVLPVDMALLSGGQDAVIVSAGNGNPNGFEMLPPVMRVPVNTQAQPFDCFFGETYEMFGTQPIAVVATADETVVIQSREPAQIYVFTSGMPWAPIIIDLNAQSRADTGHTMFHMDAGAGIACASCHPEGADDAQVWDFACIGPRRTQTLQLGLLGTEPFHWDGDMDDFSMLMNEVFVGRMAGGQPTAEQADAMATWIDTIAAPPTSAPADAAAVERGRRLFESAQVGCAQCHSGAKLTNNQSVDVGTGGTFQVPTLIGIGNRAPFIHTGCAPTLRARFTDPACGGGDRHGTVSQLSSAQIDDLVQYLETL